MGPGHSLQVGLGFPRFESNNALTEAARVCALVQDELKLGSWNYFGPKSSSLGPHNTSEWQYPNFILACEVHMVPLNDSTQTVH
eukprot:1158252-Pelagomonas_calceolata.AAC.5